jgi:hypothetical protein
MTPAQATPARRRLASLACRWDMTRHLLRDHREFEH